MSEFKGTKGKWFSCCLKSKPHFIFSEEGETVICAPTFEQEMRKNFTIEEFKANALLISKAPEMLKMLEEIKEQIEDGRTYITVDDIKKLIKEATEL